MSGILYLDRGGHVHPHRGSTQASLPPSMGFQPAPSQPYGGPHGGGRDEGPRDKPEPTRGTWTPGAGRDERGYLPDHIAHDSGRDYEEDDQYKSGDDPYIPPEKPEDKKDEETIIDKAIDKVKNIFTGPEIQQLTPEQLQRAQQILREYQALGITNPNQLRAIMANNIGGALFGKKQTYSDMEGNIIDPKDVKTMVGPAGKEILVGPDNQPVRRTKEGTMDFLGRDTLKSLQKFNPELYYPFMGDPGTMGGLEDLGREQTISTRDIEEKLAAQGLSFDQIRNSEEYKQAAKYNQMIFDAREQTSRQKDAQDRRDAGGGAGITGLPGAPVEDPFAPPGEVVTTPFQPYLSDVVLGYPMGDQVYTGVAPREGYQYTYDQEGRRYEIPIGGDQSGTTYGGNPFTWRPAETVQTPATITAPTPHDYSQWPQYPGYPTYGPAGGPVPNYINQGLGQAPQFDYWNQIARTFPGMR